MGFAPLALRSTHPTGWLRVGEVFGQALASAQPTTLALSKEVFGQTLAIDGEAKRAQCPGCKFSLNSRAEVDHRGPEGHFAPGDLDVTARAYKRCQIGAPKEKDGFSQAATGQQRAPPAWLPSLAQQKDVISREKVDNPTAPITAVKSVGDNIIGTGPHGDSLNSPSSISVKSRREVILGKRCRLT